MEVNWMTRGTYFLKLHLMGFNTGGGLNSGCTGPPGEWVMGDTPPGGVQSPLGEGVPGEAGRVWGGPLGSQKWVCRVRPEWGSLGSPGMGARGRPGVVVPWEAGDDRVRVRWRCGKVKKGKIRRFSPERGIWLGTLL